MKYKLFTLLAASFTMVACGPEKKEETPKEEATTSVADTSTVAKNLAPVVKKFNGEKYVPTKLTGSPDYYIAYFTATW